MFNLQRSKSNRAHNFRRKNGKSNCARATIQCVNKIL